MKGSGFGVEARRLGLCIHLLQRLLNAKLHPRNTQPLP
jgi:hypothetical protein